MSGETAIWSEETYRKNKIKTVTLPSGAVFTVKKRLDYADYMELLNMLSTKTGQPASLKLFDKITDNLDVLNDVINFVVPRVCIVPKVSVDGNNGSLALHELEMPDILFLNNTALRTEISPEVQRVMDSFRSGKPDG